MAGRSGTTWSWQLVVDVQSGGSIRSFRCVNHGYTMTQSPLFVQKIRVVVCRESSYQYLQDCVAARIHESLRE